MTEAVVTELVLTIRSTDGGRLYGCLSWKDGTLTSAVVHPTLEPLFRRWEAHGLDEWVGAGAEAYPRRTPVTSRDFIERAAAYVERQSGLTTVVQRRDVSPGAFVVQTNLRPTPLSVPGPRYRFENWTRPIPPSIGPWRRDTQSIDLRGAPAARLAISGESSAP